MKIVAGLGNPGAQYADTPHSVGFETVDRLAAAAGVAWEEKRAFRCLMARCVLAGQQALLFVCRGECPRELRPLSCRLFPARVLPDGKIEMDPRAAAVCPLFASGTDGFSPAFRIALQKASDALLSDESCRAYLSALSVHLQL